MKNVTLTLVMLFMLLTNAQQEMKPGFSLLENGSFKEAKVFFENYLQSNTPNKTALLCYARAVGLSGEPAKATKLFADLLQQHPGDFEIQVNYNESFLWAKEYELAKPLYQKLVQQYPNKFGAVLGYANTLSNLKEYAAALTMIEKAIAISPNNTSAKTSRKYMRLGYANEHINNQEYKAGEKLLNEIFTDFPEDRDALQNLANLYLITKQINKAKLTYTRFATSKNDTIIALNGIALAEHLNEKDKTALNIAIKAKTKALALKDTSLTQQTYNRYIQALIWNRKFLKAKQQIDSLGKITPNQNWLLALNATLGLYTGDAKKSIQNYDAILKNDSTSFDGNLGKANALLAADRIMSAYTMAYKTLDYFNNQKDALGFIKKINLMHTPTVEEHLAYTFDNGNNVAKSSNTTIAIPVNTKFKTTLSYFNRITENKVTENKATSDIVLVGLHYKFIPKTTLKTIIGLNSSKFMNDGYIQPVLDMKLMMQPIKLQNLAIGYQREVQSFNADLIEREIVQNHYSLTYNLGTNFNLGWYTQLMHTQQSDANSRNLLFTSLYYTILRKPTIKLGLNYQYITFKEQVPSIYFSPEQYQAVEFFTDVRGKINTKTTYNASAATGIQKVEKDPKTVIFRTEVGVNQQFSDRLSASIYGKYSNIASATAAGFQFTELGLKVKWLFLNKPLYLNKIQK